MSSEVAAAFNVPVDRARPYKGECVYPLPTLGLWVTIELARRNDDSEANYQSVRRGVAGQPAVVDLPGLGDHALYESGWPVEGAAVGTTHVIIWRGRLWMFVILGLPSPVPPAPAPGAGLLTDPSTRQKLADLAGTALGRAPRL